MKTIKILRREIPYSFEYSLYDEKKHPGTYDANEYLYIIKRYDENENLVEYRKLYENGKPRLERFISYDDRKRKILERTVYHETGTSEKNEYTYGEGIVTIEMFADDALFKKIEQTFAGDRIVEENHFDPDSNIMESTRWDTQSRPVYRLDGEETTNEYDENGNVTVIRHKTGDSTFEESYAYEGNVLKRVNYSENGEDMGYVEYVYEKQGDAHVTRELEGDDLISEILETKNEKGKTLTYERREYDEDGTMTKTVQTFTYDEADRPIKFTQAADPKQAPHLRHAPAMLVRSRELTYDEKGRLCEILLSNVADEELEADSYYRFEYTES